MSCDDSRSSIIRKISGTWYDQAGQPAIVIADGYLNGCPIMAVGDAAGGGFDFGVTVEIEEDAGPRFMRIGRYGKEEHSRLSIDGETYRNTPEIQHYESIGGVYLGMPQDDLLRLWGKPSYINVSRQWVYAEKGIAVGVGSRVWIIVIYPQCTLTLEHSGVNCRSSLEDIFRAYGQELKRPNPKLKTGAVEVGHGEWVQTYSYPEHIELTTTPFHKSRSEIVVCMLERLSWVHSGRTGGWK